MLLRDLQNLLTSLYRTEISVDVHDFLITDESVAKAIESDEGSRSADEKLLISEEGDGLRVSLYLAAELLERLVATDPRMQLSEDNLADFFTVLEGISHFNYVAWNATLDKSVTLMEMELQAEVDKYLAARALLQGQPHSQLGSTLYDSLFVAASFDPALESAEYIRYRDASLLAGQYCRTLERHFPGEHLHSDMVRDARTFYRLGQPDKLSHINTRAFA